MDKPLDAAAGDELAAAALISANLGKRCVATFFVEASALELRERLQSEVPGLSSCLVALDSMTMDVADIKAVKGALGARVKKRAQKEQTLVGSKEAARPAWLLVDNSVAGSYTCPAIMRGADLVIDDLSTVAGAPVGVCALSLSRDISKDATARAAAEQVATQLGRTSALSLDLADYDELCLKRNHNAQATVADLTCHPAVTGVRYPGLAKDPAHQVALHTFEHGFGPWVRFGVAGRAEAQAALQVAHELETAGEARIRSELFSAPDDESALRLAVGDEDPLALVMWLEAVLDPA